MNNVTLGVICSLCGALVSFFTVVRYYKQNTQEEAKNNTRLKDKLDYISSGVDNIRLDIKAQNMKIDSISERLTRVEESTKSAHHRIDEIKGGNEE